MGTLIPYGLFELDLEARRSWKGRDCSFRMRVYRTFPPVAPTFGARKGRSFLAFSALAPSPLLLAGHLFLRFTGFAFTGAGAEASAW